MQYAGPLIWHFCYLEVLVWFQFNWMVHWNLPKQPLFLWHIWTGLIEVIYLVTFLLYTKIIKIWIKILQLFDTIFSALNPVIYGFMSKSFRTSFRKTVCNCLGKNEELIATQWDQVKLLVGLTSNLWHWGQFVKDSNVLNERWVPRATLGSRRKSGRRCPASNMLQS